MNKMNMSDRATMRDQMKQVNEMLKYGRDMVENTFKKYNLTKEFIVYMSKYTYDELHSDLPIEDITNIINNIGLTDIMFSSYNEIKDNYANRPSLYEYKLQFASGLYPGKPILDKSEENLDKIIMSQEISPAELLDQYNTLYTDVDFDEYKRTFLTQIYDEILMYIGLWKDYCKIKEQYEELILHDKYELDSYLLSIAIDDEYKKVISGEIEHTPVSKYYIECLYTMNFIKDSLDDNAIKNVVDNYFDKSKSKYLVTRVNRRISVKNSNITRKMVDVIYSSFIEHSALPEEYYCYNGLLSYIFTRHVAYSSNDITGDTQISTIVKNIRLLFDYVLSDNISVELSDSMQSYKKILINNLTSILDKFDPYKERFILNNTLKPDTDTYNTVVSSINDRDNTYTEIKSTFDITGGLDILLPLYEDEDINERYAAAVTRYNECQKLEDDNEESSTVIDESSNVEVSTDTEPTPMSTHPSI